MKFKWFYLTFQILCEDERRTVNFTIRGDGFNKGNMKVHLDQDNYKDYKHNFQLQSRKSENEFTHPKNQRNSNPIYQTQNDDANKENINTINK